MKILYFASLRERLKRDHETWESSEGIETVDDIITTLKTRGEPWQSVFSQGKIMIAVNQEMTGTNTPVSHHDEVAFFPPVTGG